MMFKSILLSLMALLILSFAVVPALSVHAIDAKAEACKGANLDPNNPNCSDAGFTAGFKNITNVLIYIIGSISVLMIIIGGIRYVVSGGNENATKGAKDTILFAIVGVVVALFAYAIVNFVIEKIG